MKTTRHIKCAVDGCGEYAHYSYDTRADAREADLRRCKYPWTCTRHTNLDELLTVENREQSATLTATRSGELDPAKHLFWHNGKTLRSGFVFGSGYKAFAAEFPEGTKLIVTARIELPEAPLRTNDASADGARGASTEIQRVPESAGQSDTPPSVR